MLVKEQPQLGVLALCDILYVPGVVVSQQTLL